MKKKKLQIGWTHKNCLIMAVFHLKIILLEWIVIYLINLACVCVWYLKYKIQPVFMYSIGVNPKTGNVCLEDIHTKLDAVQWPLYNLRRKTEYFHIWKPPELNFGILHLLCSYNLNYMAFSNYVKFRIIVVYLITSKHSYKLLCFILWNVSVSYLIWKHNGRF
jgi:hypothetical protein